MSPKVTVGLPVYNGERHVGAAIESVLDQTYTDFELVISDNASTDGTGVLCKEYALMDDRIRYIRRPVNVGLRANFRAVFEAAAGRDYFKWAGHDDVLKPRFLERCVGHLDTHPRDVLCSTQVEMIDGEGRPLPDRPVPIHFADGSPHERLRSLFGQPKTYQTIFGLWRRCVLAKTDLLGPWYASDRALLIELSLHGGFGLVPEPLFVSREHEGRGDYIPDKVDWYMPERKDKADTAYWHHLRTVVAALATTPMPPAERLRCVGELTRRASGKLTEWPPILARELATLAAHQARRGRRS